MEFLKALHEAESFGVPRDVFMTAWERESQLMQAKEEARVLELKHSMNNGSNHDHGLLDSNTLPQLEHLVFSLTQQVNQSLQQISSVFGKELFEIRKLVTEIDVRLTSVDTRSHNLCGQMRLVEDKLHSSLLTQLDVKLNQFEEAFKVLNNNLAVKDSVNNNIHTNNNHNVNKVIPEDVFISNSNTMNISPMKSPIQMPMKGSNLVNAPQISPRNDGIQNVNNTQRVDSRIIEAPKPANAPRQSIFESPKIGGFDLPRVNGFEMPLSNGFEMPKTNGFEMPLPKVNGFEAPVPKTNGFDVPKTNGFEMPKAKNLDAPKTNGFDNLPKNGSVLQNRTEPLKPDGFEIPAKAMSSNDSIETLSMNGSITSESVPSDEKSSVPSSAGSSSPTNAPATSQAPATPTAAPPPPSTPKSYSSALQQPPKSLSPVQQKFPDPPQRFGDVVLPDLPVDWKVGTIAGPLSQASFSAVMKGLNTSTPSKLSKDGALATLPKEGADICIHGLRAFVESGRVHESEFMYSRGAPCKVRVRLTFNKHKRLSVSVLVAPGEHDDRHTFPLTFSGFGSVYNFGSRRYTQLWEVQHTACERLPRGTRERELPVYVCLCSSRDPIEDVSHDALAKKHYADDDMLAVKWSLRADAPSGSSSSTSSSSSSSTSFSALDPPRDLW